MAALRKYADPTKNIYLLFAVSRIPERFGNENDAKLMSL
jgi:hypothetical protein